MPTEAVVKESQDNLSGIINIFGTVLLAFAGISLFVAAFLIFNVFLIVVGQRVRELALLRAVGATGGQVAGSVLLEGVAVGLVASVIGYAGGLIVALLLNFVLNAGGFGSGNTELVLSLTSVIVAFAVGVGTTLLASLLPALLATRIPPVAAMREGFRLSLGSTRLLGTIGTRHGGGRRRGDRVGPAGLAGHAAPVRRAGRRRAGGVRRYRTVERGARRPDRSRHRVCRSARSTRPPARWRARTRRASRAARRSPPPPS